MPVRRTVNHIPLTALPSAQLPLYGAFSDSPGGKVVSEPIDPPAASCCPETGCVQYADLVSDINYHHTEGRATIRRGAEHFHKCGLLLIQARAEVKRRGEKWSTVRKGLAFGERRAQRYVALAKCDVTSDLLAEWRRICGNANRTPAATPEPATLPSEPGPKRPKPPELPDDGSRPLPIDPLPGDIADEIDDFVAALWAKWGLKNVTETVVAAIRYAHKGVCRG